MKTLSLSLIWIYVLEVYKKVENIKMDRLKIFPEKPYELAQHPCNKSTFVQNMPQLKRQKLKQDCINAILRPSKPNLNECLG